MSLYDRDYMRDERPSFVDRLRRVQAFQWFFWANIAVFLVQWVILGNPGANGGFLPDGGVSIEELTQGKVWTPFTYMFVHGSVGHILLNMIMLWFAGRRVQDIYGPRHFTLIYILSGLAGAALQLTTASLTSQGDAYLLGASASIMGLLLAYAVAMPEEEIYLLLMFVIPVRFRLGNLARVLLAFNLGMGLLDLAHALPSWLAGDGAPVAYLAHFAGGIAGWFYARTLGYGELATSRGLRRMPFKPMRQKAMAAVHRRPSVELDEEAIRQQKSTASPLVDLIRDEVDPILDKINDHGFHSLSDEERRILERASRKIQGSGL